jgi:predicted phage baseplate assembly protein
VAPASWIVIERPDKPEGPIVTSVNKVTNGSRPDYGLSGRTSSIEIKGEWLGPRVNPGGASVGKEDFAKVIRGTTVFAESELLTLDNTPIPEPVGGAVLELEGVHSGLEPGRLLIVAGERVDIPGTKGIKDAELVMLASVEHVPASDVPGDAVHTALTLASPLAYQYDRATVTLYGNVLHATHGESRSESLGSGDGTQASPQFALHQAPLTYVSAATPSGIASTLQVRVNDVLWHEAESLVGLGPTDRRYVTQETDDGTTIVVFGDGRQGARLPTGSDNVKARYRSGIGRAGNVAAGKINSLLMRPGGVNAVSNPQAASGGADRESPDEIRSNAPIAAMALDRLVSVQDHADFSRNFAGVGKAVAERLAVGRHQSVVVSVAGADEAPIDPASDLCTNLLAALQNFGDPHQSIQVMPAEAVLLIVAAKVRVDPDWEWASVYPAVLAALLATFGYARRNIGQDVVLSEVIATIQSVAGVAFVDVDRLDTTTVATLPADLARLADANPPRTRPASRVRALPARRGHHGSALLPAQVVYLSDRAPGLVNLSELN